MSRRERKTGQLPVFGLNSAKSAGDMVKRLASSPICAARCRKNANSAASPRRCSPPMVSKQNLMRLSMPGNTFWRFSKSYRLTSERLFTMSAKKSFVVLSVAMPVGTIMPALPVGASKLRAISANMEYVLMSPLPVSG